MQNPRAGWNLWGSGQNLYLDAFVSYSVFSFPQLPPELLINLVKVFQKKNEDFPIPDPANLYV